MAAPPTTQSYRALMALHQLVDAQIGPILGDLGLDFATESVVSVAHSEILELAAAHTPQASLVAIRGSANSGYGGTPEKVDSHALNVVEPALANAVLGRIWRTDRTAEATLTEVEVTMLHQFMRDLCRAWSTAWDERHVTLHVEFQLAASLGLLTHKVGDQQWHVVRTVVLDAGTPVGALLYCYPQRLLAPLTAARNALTWRSRARAGLDANDLNRLSHQLARIGDVRIPAPVTFTTDVPLQALEHLERGDVIALDAPAGGELTLRILDREVTANIGKRGTHLAFALTGPNATEYETPNAMETPDFSDQNDPDASAWSTPE